MIKTSNIFYQLEQRIIDSCRLKSTNESVLIAFLLVRRHMHNMGWSEEARSEKDMAVKIFGYLVDNLDYAKINLQAELRLSKKPYCEECTCTIHDKDFTCNFTADNKANCVLLNIANRLKNNKEDGNE